MVWALLAGQLLHIGAAVAEQEVETRRSLPHGEVPAQENQFQWEAVLRTLGWLMLSVCGNGSNIGNRWWVMPRKNQNQGGLWLAWGAENELTDEILVLRV